jgi:hypothetical protein
MKRDAEIKAQARDLREQADRLTTGILVGDPELILNAARRLVQVAYQSASDRDAALWSEGMKTRRRRYPPYCEGIIEVLMEDPEMPALKVCKRVDDRLADGRRLHPPKNEGSKYSPPARYGCQLSWTQLYLNRRTRGKVKTLVTRLRTIARARKKG